MTDQDKQATFDAGYLSGRAGKDSYTGYVEAYGVKPSDEPSRERWDAFCAGNNKASAEIRAQKRVDYKVDELIEKIRLLCAEYDAQITTGCGCCGAGLYVKDYETVLHIGREAPDTE